MPAKKILRCHTKHRMQRLLWAPEYESYMNLGSDDEPIVLVESPFVVETKSDGIDKMVYVCLTTESILIAEENLKAKHVGGQNLELYEKPDMTTACRRSEDGEKEGDWDLQDFYLKYLYPLQHVRLSVRQYREKEGEHVLRLRVGEDPAHLKTWYLELAGRHRELVWDWWKQWIEELEERRKQQRHRLKEFKKKMKAKNNHTDQDNIEFGELNLDWHRDIHGLVLSNAAPNMTIIADDDLNRDNDAKHIRREKLVAWHLEEHKNRIAVKHPDQVGFSDNDSLDFLDKDAVTEADIIARCTQLGIPIPANFPPPAEIYIKIGFPVPEFLKKAGGVVHEESVIAEEADSCSSLEDMLSVGSLVDSDVDWHHAVSTQTNDRLVLCVGDLFERSNVEIHEHGHSVRVRPMASDTALTQMLEMEDTNLAIDDKHHTFVGIDKEELHHTHSVPDILEGEAAFLEDDYEASQVTHRSSFVALDVVNENVNLQARIINGHVLLVTKKELRLERELIKFREEPHDLDFTTCKHKGKPPKSTLGGPRKQNRKAGMVQKYKDTKKKGNANTKKGFRSKLKHKLHLGEARPHVDGQKAIHFLKQNILLMDDLPPWAVDLPEYFTITSEEIPPEALARELTLIDKELFLMIHESELVDCMWMKHEKHTKAPNVLKAIEFFERVVRAVSADIVKRNYDWARAKAMAYFTKAAQKCLELQNFHSLKAILCGMQVPSIYRLQYSWSDFEELNPNEYRLFLELAHLMADDGCSPDYFARLEKAEKNPPYLPFLGAFLKNLTDIFTVKDEGGMRTQHKQKKPDPQEEAMDTGCSAHAKGVCYHSDEEEAEDEEEDMIEGGHDSFADLFQKVHTSKKTKKKQSEWLAPPTHTAAVQKSPAYLMNETLFHYQIAAIQYKWLDLPQVREFWLRNRLLDEVTIWKMSCEKEDIKRGREEREIRLARKAKVEEEFRKRQERIQMRTKLAEEAAAKTQSIWGNLNASSFKTFGKKSVFGKLNR